MKTLDKMFFYLMLAPKLHSLIICPGEYIDSLNQLLTQILGLSKLKYCKIAYESQASQNMFPCYLTKHDDCSPMEYLSFNGRFPFESLNNLLSCRPRLHHLSINSLVKCVREELRDVSPIKLKYLKCVSLNIDFIQFDKFEKILKTFFHSVEILNITTCYREEYSNAKKWKELILFHMPYLHIFDINYRDSI
ncbi:unnamed protein product [Rotaria socialis]|uniref:Uncharacterized protein n=2 Tax=Rotaria socialis TaxID=392032 RepID=A0A817Y176_9BILA|nr:unnamed protein product [Rotaria socialis]